MSRHPRGVIPVQANDVFFPIHAVWACGLTILQCVIYEVTVTRTTGNISVIISLSLSPERQSDRLQGLSRHPGCNCCVRRHHPHPRHQLGHRVAELPLLLLLREAGDHLDQVHTTGFHELPKKKYSWLEHREHPPRLHRRNSKHAPDVSDRLQQ